MISMVWCVVVLIHLTCEFAVAGRRQFDAATAEKAAALSTLGSELSSVRAQHAGALEAAETRHQEAMDAAAAAHWAAIAAERLRGAWNRELPRFESTGK